MAHIDYKSEQGGERSPEWYKVGAEIAELANKVSERSDLVGLAGPNAGGEAPACYKPAIAEVEVNTEIAFGFGVTPSMVGDLAPIAPTSAVRMSSDGAATTFWPVAE